MQPSKRGGTRHSGGRNAAPPHERGDSKRQEESKRDRGGRHQERSQRGGGRGDSGRGRTYDDRQTGRGGGRGDYHAAQRSRGGRPGSAGRGRGGGRNSHLGGLQDAVRAVEQISPQEIFSVLCPADVGDRSNLVDNPRLPLPVPWRTDQRIGAAALRLAHGGHVVSNFFFIHDMSQIHATWHKYHLHVYDTNGSSTEDICSRLQARTRDELVAQFFTEAITNLPAVYDGSTIVYIASSERLQELEQPFPLRSFRIQLSHVRTITIDEGAIRQEEPEVLQAFAIALKYTVRQEALKDSPNWYPGRASSAFPSTSSAVVDHLGSILVARRGYHFGFKSCKAGLAVFCDLTVAAFLEGGPIVELMAKLVTNGNVQQFKRDWSNRGRDLQKVEALLKNVRVKLTHLGHTKAFKGIARAVNSRDQTFEYEGQRVTVAEYFRRKGINDPRYRLEDPSLPAINVGSTSKPVLVPAEFVRVIPGQERSRQLPNREAAELLKLGAVKPRDRAQQTITDANQLWNVMIEQALPLQDLGLNQAVDMATPHAVPAYILPQAKLQYGTGIVDPKLQGEWKIDRQAFCTAQPTRYRAVILGEESEHQDTVSQFLEELEKCAASHGMRLARHGGMEYIRVSRDTRELRLQAHNRQEIDNVFVFINDGQHQLVKQWGDRLQISTTCIKLRTSERCQPAVFDNICTKLNAKMGGVNHKLCSRTQSGSRPIADVAKYPEHSLPWMFEQPCMLIGIDVSHPEPGSNRPSAAAVVGSLDRWCVQYACHISVQRSRQEMVAALSDAIALLITAFKNRNGGRLPSRVIVYRDGVSESQFNQVLDDELPAIEEGFNRHGLSLEFSKEGKHPIHLAIVVCQKRHHTRLWYTNSDSSNDDVCNLCPGVVVEDDITSSSVNEFYLVSHVAIQGTCKACKYSLLYDSIGLKLRELEYLTYWICYMYSRCNRSVSYATPAYYAHWASKRAAELAAAGVTSLPEISQNWTNMRAPMFFI